MIIQQQIFLRRYIGTYVLQQSGYLFAKGVKLIINICFFIYGSDTQLLKS